MRKFSLIFCALLLQTFDGQALALDPTYMTQKNAGIERCLSAFPNNSIVASDSNYQEFYYCVISIFAFDKNQDCNILDGLKNWKCNGLKKGLEAESIVECNSSDGDSDLCEASFNYIGQTCHRTKLPTSHYDWKPRGFCLALEYANKSENCRNIDAEKITKANFTESMVKWARPEPTRQLVGFCEGISILSSIGRNAIKEMGNPEKETSREYNDNYKCCMQDIYIHPQFKCGRGYENVETQERQFRYDGASKKDCALFGFDAFITQDGVITDTGYRSKFFSSKVNKLDEQVSQDASTIDQKIDVKSRSIVAKGQKKIESQVTNSNIQDSANSTISDGTFLGLLHKYNIWYLTLPVVAAIAGYIHFTNDAVCSICIESIAFYAITTKLRCGHRFHRNCLRPWSHAHNTCPYCRAAIR